MRIRSLPIARGESPCGTSCQPFLWCVACVLDIEPNLIRAPDLTHNACVDTGSNQDRVVESKRTLSFTSQQGRGLDHLAQTSGAVRDGADGAVGAVRDGADGTYMCLCADTDAGLRCGRGAYAVEKRSRSTHAAIPRPPLGQRALQPTYLRGPLPRQEQFRRTVVCVCLLHHGPKLNPAS